MDHDGVRRGYVDAGFDNGGAQQDVVTLLIKALHDFFQLALGHLAMGDGNARFRYQFLQARAPVMNGVDLVMKEVHLAAALELAQQRLAYGAAVFAAYKGFDGRSEESRVGTECVSQCRYRWDTSQ